MSCMGKDAAFRAAFGAATAGGVDDLDDVPSDVVGGGVGDEGVLKFWVVSSTRVGDWEGETLPSCLRSGSCFMVVWSDEKAVVSGEGGTGVTVKGSSAVRGAADRSTFDLLKLAFMEEVRLRICLDAGQVSVMVTEHQAAQIVFTEYVCH